MVTKVSGGSFTVSSFDYTPTTNVSSLSGSDSTPVTLATRSFVYTESITPPPASGTLTVSYRAQGRWYTLTDKGNGTLTGDDSTLGSGTVSYITGSLSLSLGFLPDVGSEIVRSWGAATNFQNRSEEHVVKPQVKYTLQNQGVQPDLLVITWNDGTARTANCSISGEITGDATGKLNLATSEILLEFINTPIKNSDLTFNYSFGVNLSSVNNTFTNTGNVVTIDFGVTNLTPGSVQINWVADSTGPTGSASFKIIGANYPLNAVIKDDGVGGLLDKFGVAIVGATIDYATGIAVFDATVVGELNVYLTTTTSQTIINGNSYNIPSVTGSTSTSVFDLDLPSDFALSYRTTIANAAPTETLSVSSLQLDITPLANESIVKNSVLFEFAGLLYNDRNSVLFHTIDPSTGAATSAGSIDRNTGIVTITQWTPSVAADVTLKSLLTDTNKLPVPTAAFRASIAPVQNSSFSMRYVSSGFSGVQTALADNNGVITGNGIFGTFDHETGVAHVVFGTIVAAAGNELEPWYDVNNIDGNGDIVRPEHAYIDSIAYNAVGVTRIPLSADILQLDPVRLPVDGRVPVFRDGSMVIILNEQMVSGNYANNEQVDLGRTSLAKIFVRDAGQNKVNSSLYTINLTTGILDFADISGVSKPIYITHRIEDRALLSDVQVTGYLNLSKAVDHDYPISGTLVCSAVIYTDLFARTSIPFDQQTWTGLWSDELIGNDVLAQLNHSLHPIEVTNASTITERWALIYTSSTVFNIVGENVGVIGTGNISTDTAPLNPNTTDAYWIIRSGAFGVGWSAGNVIRFNTTGAGVPAWLILAISQGNATDPDYSFCFELRGNIDTV